MSCTAEELPQDIWAQILQYVDFEQCLSACALVCRKLARAAAAATLSVSVDCYNRPQQHDAFLAWSSSHGSSLTKLCLEYSPSPIRQLPCPNLVELHVSNGFVQLCDSSEGLGLLHSCTALTYLSIYLDALVDLLYYLPDVPSGGVPATAMPQLKRLTLTWAWDVPNAWEASAEVDQELERSLGAHLASLEHLDLHYAQEAPGLPEPSCFLQHISTMVRLKQGSLWGTGPATTASLPGIECLTALEDLELVNCDLEPSCLLPMTTGLTKLYLRDVTLQPLQAQQDSALGAAQLLQLLARLSGLRELALLISDSHWPQQLAQYSALTASSNLQELQIDDCNIQTAVWAHVFPAGRQLPQLRSFSVWGYRDRAAFGSADVARLVSCCPALKVLEITPQPDVSLAPLKSLTALTSLYMDPVSPAAIRSDLAALSQLRCLNVSISPPAAGAGKDASSELQHLVPLTALTGLTRFGGRFDGRSLMLSSKAPAGAPPDVWVQLLERCAAVQAAQPAVISSVVRQLQQQREQVTQLQQQHTQDLAADRAEAAAAAADAAEAKTEAAEARAGAAEAMAGAAEARAEAAELRGRVQALEQQLQDVLAALQQQQWQA